MFETPPQDTYAAKGAYGQIWFYGENVSLLQAECGAWTQNANAAAHGCGAMIENKNGLFISTIFRSTTSSNTMTMGTRYGSTLETAVTGIRFVQNTIDRINIPKFTGTGHYILYGKRKWQ